MDKQLLALIHALGRNNARGEADAATCLQQLGVGQTEFFEILERLEDSGYLDDSANAGMLMLSAKGVEALTEG